MAAPYQHEQTASEESLVVCLVQAKMRSIGNDESPIENCMECIRMMEASWQENSTISLFVLPELSSIGYSEDSFRKYLPTTKANRNMLSDIDTLFADFSERLGVHVSYGTVGWWNTPSEDGDACVSTSIRQVVLDKNGNQVAVYDKMYVCDYGDCSETRFFQQGPHSQPTSFSIGLFRIGIIICADIRYPDLCRRLARDHKVDAVLQPAAFSRDVSFRTWKSFRETRAVENAVYFLAVNYAGETFGESSCTGPWVDEDNEPIVLGTGSGCLIAVIKREALDKARTSFPFHRRMMDS